MPLDVMRHLERKEDRQVFDYFYSTVGNGTSVANAAQFGAAVLKISRKPGWTPLSNLHLRHLYSLRLAMVKIEQPDYRWCICARWCPFHLRWGPIESFQPWLSASVGGRNLQPTRKRSRRDLVEKGCGPGDAGGRQVVFEQ